MSPSISKKLQEFYIPLSFSERENELLEKLSYLKYLKKAILEAGFSTGETEEKIKKVLMELKPFVDNKKNKN